MKDYNAAVAAEPPLAASAAVDGCVQFQPGTPPPHPPSLPPPTAAAPSPHCRLVLSFPPVLLMTIVRGEKQVGGHHRIRFASMARGNNHYCHPLLALIQKVSRQNFFNNIHLPRGFPTVIRKCIQRASIVGNHPYALQI